MEHVTNSKLQIYSYKMFVHIYMKHLLKHYITLPLSPFCCPSCMTDETNLWNVLKNGATDFNIALR